jgi:hypothetical protein
MSRGKVLARTVFLLSSKMKGRSEELPNSLARVVDTNEQRERLRVVRRTGGTHNTDELNVVLGNIQ